MKNKNRFEGFMVVENDVGGVVYLNNNRIPVYVYFCIVLILVAIFLIFFGDVVDIDMLGSIIILIIPTVFLVIGFKNRVDIPILNIVNNEIIFSDQYTSKSNAIKDIIIKTQVDFRLNLFGVFFTCPYRVLFVLADDSVLDIGLNFALKNSAQNFINYINKFLRSKNIQNPEIFLEEINSIDFVIESVDYAPEGLEAQLPITLKIIKKLPGEDRPDYWLCQVKKPIIWNDNNIEKEINYIIIAARWIGTQIMPKIKKLPIGISYVLDESVLEDSRLVFDKCSYVAIGLLSDSTQAGDGVESHIYEVQSGSIGKFFGTGKVD